VTASPSGDETIRAFKDAVKEGAGAFARVGALVESFKALGDEGLAILGELLRDPNSSSGRFLAGMILEGLKDPRAIPALDRAVSDPDVLVSRMASHALAVIGTRDAIPALERAMNEPTDWGVRANAAYGLAKLGEKSGTDHLLAMWRSKDDPMAPLVALGAMADVGSPEFSAELRPLIGDGAAEVGARFAAIGCATKAKDRDALPALETAIASPDTPDSVKEAARRAVNEITGEKRHAVE
jgi:HEAT repeat protein